MSLERYYDGYHLTAEEKDDRNRRIYAERLKGAGYWEIGQKVNLTGERIRQIVNRERWKRDRAWENRAAIAATPLDAMSDWIRKLASNPQSLGWIDDLSANP